MLLLPQSVSLSLAKLDHSYRGKNQFSLSLQGDFTGASSASLRDLQQALTSQPWCESVTVHRSPLTLRKDKQHSVAKEDIRLELVLR